GETKNIIFSEFNKLIENIGIAETQVEINMKIRMPANLNLRVNNKFGNVYLDDFQGDVTIDMANGKLKAHDLNGFCNLKINFGDAIINRMDAGTLEIYYGKLNLSNARKLKITSKTSDIVITDIQDLTAHSSRDDYRIRMVRNFETESSWTDFSISEFSNQSDIRMNFGDLSIEKIQQNFELIVIDARSTNINLSFDQNVDMNFDITTNNEVSLPMSSIIDQKEQIDEKENIVRYIGRTGDIKTGEPKVRIRTSSGEVTLIKR
nr:hypothetical protein [Prolixibacteraceae bacterium]